MAVIKSELVNGQGVSPRPVSHDPSVRAQVLFFLITVDARPIVSRFRGLMRKKFNPGNSGGARKPEF